MGIIKDLVGQRFGRLVVIQLIGINEKHESVWECRCDCGIVKSFLRHHLITGGTQSCGCYRKERMKKLNFKHGAAVHSNIMIEWIAWHSMKDRCYNSNNKHYKDYGGRGIIVCDRWLGDHGFENFLKDMGKKPGKKYSLDRINNNGNYTPNNTRWATQEDQICNRRSSIRVKFGTQTIYLMTLCKEFKVSYKLVYNRIKYGWPILKALTFPKRGAIK